MLRTAVIAGVVAVAVAIGMLSIASMRGEQVVLRLSAGGTAGEYYRFAQALSTVARERGSDFTIEVLESGGAAENASAVADGRAELGLVQSDTIVAPAVRAVAAVFPEVFHVIARAEAGIASPRDFAGKRIAAMPEGSGANALFFRIAEHYDLDATDFALGYFKAEAAIEAIIAGDADVMVRMIALGNAGMHDLLVRPEMRLVGLDQAEAIQLFAPGIVRATIPRGAVAGAPAVPPAAIDTLGVRALLVTSEEVAPDVVESLTQLIFAARNRLVELSPPSAFLTEDIDWRGLGFPLHAGAERFYTADRPPFIVAYSDSIALGLSAGALVLSALWQIHRWLDGRQKNRGDRYNGAIADSVQQLLSARRQEDLETIEARLYALFTAIVSDIDNDRLKPEAMASLSFVWQAATTLAAQRRAELAWKTGPHSGQPLPNLAAMQDLRSHPS